MAHFMTNFYELIPNNLESIVSLMKKEKSVNVVTCFVSFMDTVIQEQPALYPVILQAAFDLIDKHKSNWLTIKIIHLFHRLITLDQRLVKKLADPFYRILKQTNSKSVEYEINRIAVTYFHASPKLYETSVDNIKTFISSSDRNIKQLGFKLLPVILRNDPGMINEFSEALLEAFKTSDTQVKRVILGVFREFITKEIYQEIVITLLSQLDAAIDKTFKVHMIRTVLTISQQNDYSIIEDINVFLNTILRSIIKHLNDTDVAIMCAEVIKDIFLKIDEVQPMLVSYTCSIIELVTKHSAQHSCSSDELQFIFDCTKESDEQVDSQVYHYYGIVIS